MMTQTDESLIFLNYTTIAKSSHIGFKVLHFFINQTFKKNYNLSNSKKLVLYSDNTVQCEKYSE